MRVEYFTRGENNEKGRQITLEFDTVPLWTVPIEWTRLGAVIETHGSTYSSFNAFRRLAEKSSYIKDLPTEVLEMILSYARDDVLAARQKEWKKFRKCLKQTCGHKQDKAEHRDKCRRRITEFNAKLQGPETPVDAAMDFTVYQKRFTRDFGLRAQITKKAQHEPMASYDLRIATKRASNNDYYGYLMLPMKGPTKDLDLLGPYDLLPYEYNNNPNERQKQKIEKQKWRFTKAMHMYHLQADRDYTEPIMDIATREHGKVATVGNLQKPEGVIVWPALIHFGKHLWDRINLYQYIGYE